MSRRRHLARIAAVGGAVLATGGATIGHALSQTRPAVPNHLVALSNQHQAYKVASAFGRGALWAYDKKTNSFRSTAAFHPRAGETLFATRVQAKELHLSFRRPRNPVTTTTSAPAPTATTTAASPSPSVSGATSTPSSMPAAPAGFSAAQQELSDNFAGSSISTANWNTYITSAGADGYPWNSNNAGGSSPGNPTTNYNADYDLPTQITVDNGLQLNAHEGATAGILGTVPTTFAWSGAAVSSYGKFQMTGGYLQIDAKMPSGDGMWPALWLLPGAGTTGGDDYEIDLFEGGMTGNGSPGADNYAWHLHVPGGNTVGGLTDTGVDLSAGYHLYGLDWVPGQSLTWYLDGNQIGQITSAQASIPDVAMELIMNNSVTNAAAASWHTSVDSSTPTSTSMSVASVQVYS